MSAIDKLRQALGVLAKEFQGEIKEILELTKKGLALKAKVVEVLAPV